ncbi:hypothetical protein [Bacteroides acidifaciens]|jgi:hypothetical protein|uniref:Uncharacterized protein n=1 Tax=Bacteroides acidifaciens TaxID=85831 RepID=A0A4S2B2V3_9BACE|nr:hypothetical protein [Bacteroides acidifaciens]TGY08378.1 hypothetical protein E5356_01030 [Bacteroides acidifaciens]
MKCETIYIALIGLVLAACNGDVFVDDYLPHGAATVLMSEDNRTAEITFTSDNLPAIVIPDIINQEKPVLGNTKIPFGIKQQYIAADVDKDKAVEVKIDAHDKRKVVVYNYLERYEVPLKVYASNPITGGKREFSAFLYSQSYINYLIFKEKMESEQYD